MRGGAKIGCIGDLLVEFVCATKNGRHARRAPMSGPYPSGAAGIFIDQAAQVGGRLHLRRRASATTRSARSCSTGWSSTASTPQLIRVVKGVPTGTAFVSYNDDGSRDFVYNIMLSAAARFEADDATIAALDAFGLDVDARLRLGARRRRHGGKVLRVCKALHGKGVTISFDPNVRKELVGNPAYFAAVSEMIDMASIFLPSEDDVEALFPGRDFDDIAAEMFARGAALRRAQEGRQGLRRRDPRRRAGALSRRTRSRCSTRPAPATASARPSSPSGRSRRLRLPRSARRANAAGALAVTKVGPMEGNSTWRRSKPVWRGAHDRARLLAEADRRQSRRRAARDPVLVHRASADAERDRSRPIATATSRS